MRADQHTLAILRYRPQVLVDSSVGYFIIQEYASIRVETLSGTFSTVDPEALLQTLDSAPRSAWGSARRSAPRSNMCQRDLLKVLHNEIFHTISYAVPLTIPYVRSSIRR